MAPFPRTPEVTCPWGHVIRPDGSHIVPADLERHIWKLEELAGISRPCVNHQLCIYAGAPWHEVTGRHVPPSPHQDCRPGEPCKDRVQHDA